MDRNARAILQPTTTHKVTIVDDEVDDEMKGLKPGPRSQIRIDESGGLHFNGSTEELHSYVDTLNQSVAWMNSHWEEYLNSQQLSRVAEIRAWWKNDSGGISELSPEGWPTYGFPEPVTEAFARLTEISQFHRLAEERMVAAAEISEGDEAKVGTNPPASAE